MLIIFFSPLLVKSDDPTISTKSSGKQPATLLQMNQRSPQPIPQIDQPKQIVFQARA